MKYNPEHDDLCLSLGISQERGDELTDAVEQVNKEAFNAAQEIGEYDRGIMHQCLASLPQTLEEAYYLGVQNGSMMAESWHLLLVNAVHGVPIPLLMKQRLQMEEAAKAATAEHEKDMQK